MIEFNPHYSRAILIRMLILTILVMVLALLGYDFLHRLYLENQTTLTGYLANGAIILLFLLGLGRVAGLLWRYRREEAALGQFAEEMALGRNSPSVDVDEESLIFHRFRLLTSLSRQRAPIDHNALASALLASESTRTSLPRFINNILILGGVFGTIISLSIALMGASNLLDNASDTSQMGLVIHGMSTALSTTLTAIVCYVFHGYFYMKLNDAQTQLLSGIEQVTAVHLLPRINVTPESLLHEVAELVRALREVTDGLRQTQQSQRQAGEALHAAVAELAPGFERLGHGLDGVERTLRSGFRLSSGGDEA